MKSNLPILFSHKKKAFRSILKEAIKQGLLTQKQLETIQMQVYELSKKLVLKYNHNRSTCISSIVYKRIMNSIYYALDHAIVMYPNAIEALHTISTVAIYELGLQLLADMVDEVETLLQYLNKGRFREINERYQDVIDNQILYFISGYDIEYRATYCKYDLDYPLIDGIPLDHDMYHLKGIDLVKEYATRFSIEERFCRRYSEEDVNWLFVNYERQKGVRLAFLGVNFCELIMTQIFFTFMLSRSFENLILTKEQALYIKEKVEISNVTMLVETIFQCLKKEFDDSVVQYLMKAKGMLIQRMEIAQRENAMLDLIVYEQPIKQMFELVEPTLQDNKHYLACLQKIQLASNTQEKVDAILHSNFSLYDYIDLLDLGILDDKESTALFQQLDIYALGLLLKYSCEEAFMFHSDVTLNEAFFVSFEKEEKWMQYFFNYLLHLTDEKKKEIADFVKETISF